MNDSTKEMTEVWKNHRIAEIAMVKTGGTPRKDEPSYWGGSIPWMASGDIHQKRVKYVEGRITEKGFNQSNARMLPAGTVMIALNGQGKTRGTVAILETPLTCNQSLAGIIPDSSYLDSNYLFYNLESRYKEIRNITGDDTRTGLNLKLISDIHISIPPIPKQRKIVDILMSVDGAIEKTEAIIKQMEVIKQGLVQQLLFKGIGHTTFKMTEIGEVPTDWEIVKMNDLFLERREASSDIERYPLYSLTIEVGLTPKTERYERSFLLKNKEENQYRLVFPDDIVFNPMNLRFGAISIFKEESPVSVSAYYNVLQLKDSKCNSADFFAALFKSKAYMKRFENISTGTLIEKKRVHWSQFKMLDIPLPPKEEQYKIVSILQSTENKVQKEFQYLEMLKKMKSALIHDLMTGKVRVNVDEPSEVSV
jgi:type I restriction enzyme, S subunit